MSTWKLDWAIQKFYLHGCPHWFPFSKQPSPFLPLLLLSHETGKLREGTGFVMLSKRLLYLQRAVVVEVAEVMRISSVTGRPHGDDNRQLLTANRHYLHLLKENGCFSSGPRIVSWQMWDQMPDLILTSYAAVCLSAPHLKARFLASLLLSHILPCYLPPIPLNMTLGNITRCSHPQ